MASPKRTPLRLSIPIALLLALSLAGCVTLNDPESFQEQNQDIVAVASPGETIGQTLISRRARLNGVWLWLALPPGAPEQPGELLVELYTSPLADSPLASARLPLAEIRRSSPILASFPAQPDPPGQAYYLHLSADQGEVQARGRLADVYTQGSAFVNLSPVPGDLAFRLSYEYGLPAILEDLGALLRSAWLLIPLGLTLFLPGWLILDLSGLARGYDTGERAALSLGLSLSLIPILMTWTSLLGLPWNRAGTLIVAAALSALALWRLRGRFRLSTVSRPGAHSLALGGILILTLFVRTAMARDLAASPWVDSVHHAAITRLILEQGNYPESYAPYIPIDSASYHAGYHSALAAFLWLSGLPLAEGMLVFGQVLNALIVLAVYLLATALCRDRTVGVFAALVAGLFTPMPAYYTSWGRYTQLAGLLVLPVVISLLVRLLESGEVKFNLASVRVNWKAMLVAGISVAGLILVHYRVAAFAACLLAADLLTRLPAFLRRGTGDAPGKASAPRKLGRGLGWLAAASFLGLLLSLPWLAEAIPNLLLPKYQAWSPGRPALFSGFAWNYLDTAWGKPAMWLAALGLVAGLIRPRRLPFSVLLWVAALFTLANLGSLGLPGNGLVNNTSVGIMLFMPLALLAGYFLRQPLSLFERFAPPAWRRPALAALWLGGGMTALFAARALLPILNPITFLYREADSAAMAWLDENLPPGETVLINPFLWGYSLYAGNDGGYWIGPLAGRATLPPPVLYGLDNDPQRVQHISQLSQQVIERGTDPPALHELMLAENLRYLYIGARGGPLSAAALLESPLFELLYSQGGTWVFLRK